MLQTSGFYAALLCCNIVAAKDLQQCLQSSPHAQFQNWGTVLLSTVLARTRSYLASLAAGSC